MYSPAGQDTTDSEEDRAGPAAIVVAVREFGWRSRGHNYRVRLRLVLRAFMHGASR